MTLVKVKEEIQLAQLACRRCTRSVPSSQTVPHSVPRPKPRKQENRPFASTTFKQTVHMKCAVLPKQVSHVPRFPFPDPCQRSKRTVPPLPQLSSRRCTRSVPSSQTVPPFPVLRARPGTQYDTSARYLRKQLSKLPFKRPTPNTGQCTRMCTAANCAKEGAFGGDPAPHSRELERLVCSAS